jgi:hypothetical protein
MHMATASWVLGIAVVSAAIGCSEFGRALEESRALKIAQNKAVPDAEALTQIAQACTSEPKLGVKVEGGWLHATVGTVHEVHKELIDRQGKLDMVGMNVQGYQRQLARQAICMFYAGRLRGLEGVRLRQRISVTLGTQTIDLYEVSFTRKAVEAVPEWDVARLDRRRWSVYDAVFRTGQVHADRTSELKVVKFE